MYISDNEPEAVNIFILIINNIFITIFLKGMKWLIIEQILFIATVTSNVIVYEISCILIRYSLTTNFDSYLWFTILLLVGGFNNI